MLKNGIKKNNIVHTSTQLDLFCLLKIFVPFSLRLSSEICFLILINELDHLLSAWCVYLLEKACIFKITDFNLTYK